MQRMFFHYLLVSAFVIGCKSGNEGAVDVSPESSNDACVGDCNGEVDAALACTTPESCEGQPASGLEWAKFPETRLNGVEAATHCDSLDHDGKTDWRLPTVDEWRKVVSCASTETSGACNVADNGCRSWDCWEDCEGCEYILECGNNGSKSLLKPFPGCSQGAHYWTATTFLPPDNIPKQFNIFDRTAAIGLAQSNSNGIKYGLVCVRGS